MSTVGRLIGAIITNQAKIASFVMKSRFSSYFCIISIEAYSMSFFIADNANHFFSEKKIESSSVIMIYLLLAKHLNLGEQIAIVLFT